MNIKRQNGHARNPAFLLGGFIVIGFIFVAVFADFLSPYDYRAQALREPGRPPALIFVREAEGQWRRPFIYASRLVDPLERRYEIDPRESHAIEFFSRGYAYRLFGIYSTDRHLFGLRTAQGASVRICLLGTDDLGRDRFSRLVRATRFSIAAGPVGAIFACLLGALIGCIAGYAHPRLDSVLMRAADVMLSLPALVLILAARAAFPPELPPPSAMLLLVSLFIAVGWAETARLARAQVLSLRRQDFIQAAISLGASRSRIFLRHILPNAAPSLFAQFLFLLPTFLLAETSLSFLGVGLQEPEPSWGNLLAQAYDLARLEGAEAPILLAPAMAVMLLVIGVRLLGHGEGPLD